MPHLSYAAHTATRLNADLINLGMSGSCHAGPEMTDYIASRKDWDLAVLSLSVNMVGCFSVEEFRKRVEYTVYTAASAEPRRPVACITLFPYFNGLCTNHAGEEEEKTEAFRQVLRETAAKYPGNNLTLIEGPEILDKIDGLTADLIHPSDAGMLRMGENLARRLETLF